MNIHSLKVEIEQALDRLIPEKECSYSDLFIAARYCLLAPAKRLRPLLTLLTIDLLGKDYHIGIQPACAIEMIHTYSLIHDDLPCMDNDLMRRGKPTLHRVYTEGHAVLAGDYLLTAAFETLAASPTLSSKQRIELVRTLACFSGGDGMIGGQVLDIQNTEKKHNFEELYARKTGGLFQAAFLFGGIIAKASPSLLKELAELGRCMGILFQAADDISDGALQKQACQAGSLFYEKTLECLDKLPYETEALRSLVNQIGNFS